MWRILQMYFDSVKQRFEVLRQLRSGKDQPQPCTIEEIEELSAALGTQLPAAYIEFLFWTGNGGGCFAGDEFDHRRVANLNKSNAYSLLQRYGKSGELANDAIVIIFYHGGYAFDFICVSEGDNPPVHHVLETEEGIEIITNFSDNIAEHCLKSIERRIIALNEILS
jgi:hypothetical protein